MRNMSATCGILLIVITSLMTRAAEPELVRRPSLPPAPLPQELSAGEVGLRIIMGLKDAEPTDWSGEVTLSTGKLLSVRCWRWMANDGAKENGWTVHTRRPAPGSVKPKPDAKVRLPIGEVGVVLMLSGVTDDTKIQIKTAAGGASFGLSEIPYGKPILQLNGAMEIDRVPAIAAVARTNADEDYPAAATAPDGTVYLTYLAFTRGKDFQGHRERLTAFGVAPISPLASPGPLRKIEKPEDFDYLREPAGGEMLYLRTLKNGKLSEPVVVADGRKVELYRPAIAVEGSGKVCVVYSAHLNADADLDGGDWELMARRLDPQSGQWEEPVNLSNAAGTDFMPAATTDSSGRVWVTWVGLRGEHFSIFASHQTTPGGAFTPAARLTQSTGNEWEPSIATDRNGNVAVAWD